MAWTAHVIDPSKLPPVIARAWYPTTRQQMPLLKIKRPPGPVRRTTTDPAVIAIWGQKYVCLMRGYWKMIGQWWKQGKEHGGPDFWNYLASIYPLVDYFGRLVTVPGCDWFSWYQKKSLSCEGWLGAMFNPQPQYFVTDSPGQLCDYPDYPRQIPLALPPAPSWDFVSAGPNLISVMLHWPGWPRQVEVTAQYSITPPGLLATVDPRHQLSIGWEGISASAPADIPYYVIPSQLHWPMSSAFDSYIGIWYFDRQFRTPGATTWKIVRST
jgi:hypothetical protein